MAFCFHIPVKIGARSFVASKWGEDAREAISHLRKRYGEAVFGVPYLVNPQPFTDEGRDANVAFWARTTVDSKIATVEVEHTANDEIIELAGVSRERDPELVLATSNGLIIQ